MEPVNMKMPATEEQKSQKSHESLCSLPSRKLCLKKRNCLQKIPNIPLSLQLYRFQDVPQCEPKPCAVQSSQQKKYILPAVKMDQLKNQAERGKKKKRGLAALVPLLNVWKVHVSGVFKQSKQQETALEEEEG